MRKMPSSGSRVSEASPRARSTANYSASVPKNECGELAYLRRQLPSRRWALSQGQIAALDAVVHITVAGCAQGLVIEAGLTDDLSQLLGKSVHSLKGFRGCRNIKAGRLPEFLKSAI